MQEQAMRPPSREADHAERVAPSQWRGELRVQALTNALRKRAAGVPTYSVPEAAALLSISQEYLYRLIQAGGFPALRMRLSGTQGRYVVPAKTVERLLDDAAATCGCLEVGEWARRDGDELADGGS